MIDNIFRQKECEIGTNKVLDVSAVTKHFCRPSTSTFTIASIALPKLLSPSHSAHSVSLSSDFTQWCADNEIELMGFKGLQANRFGKIASNAKTFLEYETAITEFFEEVVDDSDNKLVTACAHYIRNRWFKICCEVYVFIAELIICPLMDLIGIDNAKKIKREDRNWIGIFHLFLNKLSELSVQQGIFAAMDGGKNGIISEILLELVGAIKHQLREMKFFDAISIETPPGDPSVASLVDRVVPNVSNNTLVKLEHASQTNLGWESSFTVFDSMVGKCGGGTSIKTLSSKRVDSQNKFLVRPEMLNLPELERKDLWSWARKSEESVKARRIEEDMQKNICNVKKMALEVKMQKKKKRRREFMSYCRRLKHMVVLLHQLRLMSFYLNSHPRSLYLRYRTFELLHARVLSRGGE